MPLLWISLFFIAGIVLGAALPWAAAGWLSLALSCLLLWPLLRRLPDQDPVFSRLHWLACREPRLFLPPILLGTALFFGAARFASSAPDLAHEHIAAFNDQGRFRITAVMVAPPDPRDRSTLLRLQSEALAPINNNGSAGENQPVHGLILAVLPAGAEWQYGDRLMLDGAPVTPPENEAFSYRDYLARQGVYTYLTYPRVRLLQHNAGNPIYAAIYHLRDWAHVEVYHLFPAPEAPLLAGILLGIESGMPDSLSRAFQDTGTAHVIAISGFNIAILAGLFSSLFGKILSRWWAMVASILAISAYTVMVGGTPSVVRAAIMGGLSLLAHQLGRRSAGMNTLFLTGALMCLANPNLPWDASFQLSFGATAGLILYGERFQNGFTALLERRFSRQAARRIAGPVSEYVLLTLAAQLMTLPVILYHFQRLSLSSLLANPLILPPQPLVMVLSGIAVLVGAVSDPLAHLLAWLAWPLSAYTNRMVELLAQIPGGVLVLGEMGPGTLLLMYTAVLIPLWKQHFPAALRSAMRPAMLLVGTGLLAAVLWRAAASVPDGRVHLLIFDMNGSQALLVHGASGETVLVNGGPSARLLDNALGRWLSPFDRRLDALLLNDERASAISGLTGVLDRYPPGQALWGCAPPESRTAEDLIEMLKDRQTPAYSLVEGNTLAIGKDLRLQTLSAGKSGSALLLVYGNFRVLVPAGIAPSRLAMENLANLSLLVLDARDLKDTPSEAWLALAPQAIIATPADSAILPEGRNWFNTQAQGWYTISTDGRQMWIERGR